MCLILSFLNFLNKQLWCKVNLNICPYIQSCLTVRIIICLVKYLWWTFKQSFWLFIDLWLKFTILNFLFIHLSMNFCLLYLYLCFLLLTGIKSICPLMRMRWRVNINIFLFIKLCLTVSYFISLFIQSLFTGSLL